MPKDAQYNFFWLIVSLVVLALFAGILYLVIQKTDVYAPGDDGKTPEAREIEKVRKMNPVDVWCIDHVCKE